MINPNKELMRLFFQRHIAQDDSFAEFVAVVAVIGVASLFLIMVVAAVAATW